MTLYTILATASAESITASSPVTIYAVVTFLSICTILFGVGRFFFNYTRDNILLVFNELKEERREREKLAVKLAREIGYREGKEAAKE